MVHAANVTAAMLWAVTISAFPSRCLAYFVLEWGFDAQF